MARDVRRARAAGLWPAPAFALAAGCLFSCLFAGSASAEPPQSEGSGAAVIDSDLGMQAWWMEAGVGLSHLRMAATFDAPGGTEGRWDGSGSGLSYALGFGYTWRNGFTIGVGWRYDRAENPEWEATAGDADRTGTEDFLGDEVLSGIVGLTREQHRVAFRSTMSEQLQVNNESIVDVNQELELDYTYNWFRSADWEVGTTCALGYAFRGRDDSKYDADLMAFRLLLNVAMDIEEDPRSQILSTGAARAPRLGVAPSGKEDCLS